MPSTPQAAAALMIDHTHSRLSRCTHVESARLSTSACRISCQICLTHHMGAVQRHIRLHNFEAGFLCAQFRAQKL